MPQPLSSLIQNTNSEVFISSGPVVGSGGIDGGGVQIWALALYGSLYRTGEPGAELEVVWVSGARKTAFKIGTGF